MDYIGGDLRSDLWRSLGASPAEIRMLLDYARNEFDLSRLPASFPLTAVASGGPSVNLSGAMWAGSGAGYQRASYTVHLKTKGGATPAQVAELKAAPEASPVGDTLERNVPVSFELDVS